MKTEHREIDINAHITNITCNITVDNGIPETRISFTNLGYGTIEAVKFKAMGFNSFGDIVYVDGEKYFFVVLQDINVKVNESASNLKVNLPSSDIRRLELEECQIRLSDGSYLTYEGKNIIEYDIDTFDYDIENEQEIATALKSYESSAVCLPKNMADGWVCVCGHYNKISDTTCKLCRNNKDRTFEICSEEGLKKLVEQYKERQEALQRFKEDWDNANENNINIRKKKQKRNRYIIISIVIVLLTVSLYSYFYPRLGYYKKTKWGMSSSKVQKIYPDIYFNYNRTIGYLDIYDNKIGIKANISYYFTDDKLTNVREWIVDTGSYSVRELLDRINDKYTSLYGKRDGGNFWYTSKSLVVVSPNNGYDIIITYKDIDLVDKNNIGK